MLSTFSPPQVGGGVHHFGMEFHCLNTSHSLKWFSYTRTFVPPARTNHFTIIYCAVSGLFNDVIFPRSLCASQSEGR